MQGICKKTNSIGVPTHVLVRPDEGAQTYMRIEEYVDQGIKPEISHLPVCPEENVSDG
jgi:hypothetical protein